MPKLSVVIPVYNARAYLVECVGSVLKQSFTDFELILVDDGSTDGSTALCTSFEREDWRVKVYHTENRGVSHARNLGIAHARGKYLLFADSDDWYADNAFETLMSVVGGGDLTFFGSCFHYADHEEPRSPDAFMFHTKADVQGGLLRLAYSPDCPDYVGFTWNKLFVTSIIRKYQLSFMTSLSIREDEIFTLHYIRYCSSMQAVSDLLYHYRKHSGGLTARRRTSQELDALSSCYMALDGMFENQALNLYCRKQALVFSLAAVRAERQYGEFFDVCVEHLWSCRASLVGERLPVKPFYRFLLRCPSPLSLRLFMRLRMSFKRGKN